MYYKELWTDASYDLLKQTRPQVWRLAIVIFNACHLVGFWLIQVGQAHNKLLAIVLYIMPFHLNAIQTV